MMKTVMTVTGPVSPDDLGMTLMHEHFTIAFLYGWAGQGICLRNMPAGIRISCSKDCFPK
jgi:predicted metal-dependent phosphotriesterase family hydrolase